MNYLTARSGFIVLLFSFFLIQSCKTTDSALDPNQTHYYQNSFQEVIDAAGESLQKASMIIHEAEELNEDTYFIKYYRKKYDIGNQTRNPESALTATITIEKSDADKTKLTIDEEEQSHMVPMEFREQLGRDVLRELDKLLIHQNGSDMLAKENR